MGIVDIVCLFIARGEVGKMAVGILLKRAIEVFRRKGRGDSMAGGGYVLLIISVMLYMLDRIDGC
jgi:hypothetical protein